MSNSVSLEGNVEYVEADFADAYAALPQSRRALILLPAVVLVIFASTSRASSI